MRIVFIGASGHGKVCADIAALNGYDEILFMDGNRELHTCGNYLVVGTEEDFIKLVDSETDFFVSIGDIKSRRRIQKSIKHSGGNITTLIHPGSIVSKDVKIGIGSVIMAGAVVNPGTVIGEGVIVNTASSIDHDCIIGDYAHIAVGSHICGTVNIGKYSWIGAGATISNNISICNDCVIGAGALVIRDITVPDTYVGVPVKT